MIVAAISAAVACVVTLILWAVRAIVLIHIQPPVTDPFSIVATLPGARP